MEELWRLIADNQTVAGRLVTSVVLGVIAFVLGELLGRLAAARADDQYTRYHTRKFAKFAVGLTLLIALAIVWKPFAGRIGVVLGLMAAGVAFAMQEVIGALAGWFNIVSGRIYRVGDRIELAGVQGDVIDITLLRTKVLEIGGAGGGADGQAGGSWVKGRQHTGRIVAISNKATFTDPVYNYSGVFEFIWEELMLPVPHEANWREAERLLLEEAQRVSDTEEARAAMRDMRRRYPVPPGEIAPRVFARITDNWMELSARFVVPVRSARTIKHEMAHRLKQQLEQAGIPIASETSDVTFHAADDGPAEPG